MGFGSYTLPTLFQPKQLSFCLLIHWYSAQIFISIKDGSDGKQSPTMQETWVQSLGQEDPLEKGMATEEPSRLQSMGLQRVRHD